MFTQYTHKVQFDRLISLFERMNTIPLTVDEYLEFNMLCQILLKAGEVQSMIHIPANSQDNGRVYHV
jgi:hypothetical protein